MVLADSNLVTDFIKPQHAALQAFFARENPDVSAVSVVEVLGYHLITPADKTQYERFFQGALVHAVTDAVIQRAVALRQARKMSLGNALIAATALEHNLTLVTRNTADFKHVPGLTLVDPLAP